MMKVADIQTELARLEEQAETMDPEELERALARFANLLDRIETDVAARERQAAKESGVEQKIQQLEGRVKRIRDDAQELEETDLQRDARQLFTAAERLARSLQKIKEQALRERITTLPAIQRNVGTLEGQVQTLEQNYNALLQRLDEEDEQAREEDTLHDVIRPYLLRIRVAQHYYEKGCGEHESLTARTEHIERAQRILATLPGDANAMIQHGWPRNVSEKLANEVQTLKTETRLQLDDIQHIMSEGVIDKDAHGGELSLPYAMRKHWKSGDKDGFYKRLWAMHFLMRKDRNVNPKLLEKVRSLLVHLNGAAPSAQERQRRLLASEARRFLLMAGKGIIRKFLEEQYNGLRTQDDYVRLGEQLSDPGKPLHMLQLAVNLPRLFDLQLNDRFKKIYEKRIKKQPVRTVSVHHEERPIDDYEDFQDVDPGDLYDGFVERLLDGELTATTYEDRQVTEVEIGEEKTVEAQIYLMDASGSMYTDGTRYRWFLRNALFMAALNTFSVDATVKGQKEFSNMLFFRMFGSQVGPLYRVRNQREALGALKTFLNLQEDLGGTALQRGMETVYSDIRTAKGSNRRLRDAKVVVVTDGDVSLYLPNLQAAANIDGTNVVTHVFATEGENQDLKTLSQTSGAGRAFYYYISNSVDPRLAAFPPYGTAGEFSPLYPERTFANNAEREAFEGTVGTLCDEIVNLTRQDRHSKGEKEKQRARELDELMGLTRRAASQGGPYETGKTPGEIERKTRKSRRVEDIMNIIDEVTHDKMTKAEAMNIFRHLARARALRPKDYKAVIANTGNQDLKEKTKKYRDQKVPKLAA